MSIEEIEANASIQELRIKKNDIRYRDIGGIQNVDVMANPFPGHITTWYDHRNPDGACLLKIPPSADLECKRSGYAIHVTGFPYDRSVNQIIEMFAEFGTPIGVNVPQTEAGKPVGFMLLQYQTQGSAERAVQMMDCVNIEGTKWSLSVELATKEFVLCPDRASFQHRNFGPGPRVSIHGDGNQIMPRNVFCQYPWQTRPYSLPTDLCNRELKIQLPASATADPWYTRDRNQRDGTPQGSGGDRGRTRNREDDDEEMEGQEDRRGAPHL